MPVIGGGGGGPGGSLLLTGTGGLFTRIGKIGNIINIVNKNRGTDVPAAVNSMLLQFDSADQDVTNNIFQYLGSYQSACSGLPSNLRTMAQSMVTEMVNEVAAQTSQSSYTIALKYLINYMAETGQSVQSCLVSSSWFADPANVGNPTCVVSIFTPDGLVSENCFSENVTATVSQDSQTSPQLIYQEQFILRSPYTISDPLDWRFPVGSGVVVPAAAVNGLANSSGGSQNWLNNGSMESWNVSANFPDAWHIAAGSPSSFIRVTAGGSFYDGSSSLGLIGDGSSNLGIYQQFSLPGSISSDSPITIYPYQQLAFNLFAKVDVVPAAGVLRVALTDASGTVINDAQGNANSFNISLPSLTTSFVAKNFTFRTPAVIPTSGVQVRLSLTTPLSAGSRLFIDRLAMAQMTQLYANGPSVSIFSGNARMISGDSITINIFNNYAGKFQRLFDALFAMRQNGLKVPSSNSPTIPDSLIS